MPAVDAETGTPVAQGFEYNSGNNTDWLPEERSLEMDAQAPD